MTVVSTAHTKLLVGSLVPGQRLPSTFTLNASNQSNLAPGTTTLPVAASPVYLQAGRKIVIGGVEIVVRADSPRGATAIPIEANTVQIPANANGQVSELFEFLGGEGLDVNGQDNTINIRNFRSGQWSESAKVMVGVTFDTEGQFHKEDRAIINVVRPAYFKLGQEIYAELTRANGDRYAGAFLVSGYSEAGALDNVLRVQFTLNSQGAIAIPAELPLTTA